jgi:two-component system chemotaxis sensor kinase CheA
VASERLARVRALAAALDDAGPSAGEVLEEIGRELHTLKGEARVVGAPEVAQAVHAAEELLRGEARSPADFVSALSERLDVVDELSFQTDVRAAGPDEKLPLIERLLGATDDTFVRVSLDVLGGLGEAAAELRVGESDLAQLFDELTTFLPALPPDVAARQRRCIARGRQVVFEQHHRLAQLHDRVRAARMVRLSTLLAPFPRAARELGAELGKEIEVSIEGAGVEVDQKVLELLREPLVHLVRNAVDHGIETPEQRLVAGKPRAGHLVLRARTLGPTVTVEIEDDGRGVDVEAVAAALRARGESVEVPASPEGLLELLCRHGLSTRTATTEHSGRGVGLDVVKRRTESLGGRLSLRSRPGHGTSFVLAVPMTTVLSAVMCMEVDGVLYGLAPHEIERVEAMQGATIEHAGSALVVRTSDDDDEELVPLADLGTLLDGTPRDPRRRSYFLVAVDGSSRLALAVDRFVGTQVVLQQRLDTFLERNAALRSVAVLASGQLAVALDAAHLFARRGVWEDAPVGTRTQGSTTGKKRTALVVDDSELTRDVLVSVLRELGLDVVEAANGQLALDALGPMTPDVVLTDLDMPVMDGFGLLARLRMRHTEVPVVVLSTRGSPEDIARAVELGADAYLIKTQLDLDELRDVVRRHLRVGRAASDGAA